MSHAAYICTWYVSSTKPLYVFNSTSILVCLYVILSTGIVYVVQYTRMIHARSHVHRHTLDRARTHARTQAHACTHAHQSVYRTVSWSIAQNQPTDVPLPAHYSAGHFTSSTASQSDLERFKAQSSFVSIFLTIWTLSLIRAKPSCSLA